MTPAPRTAIRPSTTEPPSPRELAEVSARLETAPASAVVAWAVDRFGDGLVLASSFEDCVLIDIATRVAPGVEVVFLDTGFHFPETLEFVETVRARYDLNLRVESAGLDPGCWPCGTEMCCRLRKVEPLDRLLSDRGAWMTGLRRADSPTRADAAIVAWDDARGVAKVNPIANWSDLDVKGYSSDRRLPRHPLLSRGYASIGCAPTTSPVAEGADARSGRWAGTDKTECGLHI